MLHQITLSLPLPSSSSSFSFLLHGQPGEALGDLSSYSSLDAVFYRGREARREEAN